MPVLSGFLPIPLALMIPFMGAQSLVIGKQFGEGFQYGKRKISAMTNEEFNKLTPQKLAHDSAKELQSMIPSMAASITDMRQFQSFLIQELIATAKQLPSDIFQGLTEGQDPNAHLTSDSPFGVPKDFATLLKKLATAQFVGYGPKGSQATIENTQQPQTSFGPVGPQLPTIDPLYANLSDSQLHKIKNSSATWNRIPQTQKDLITARLKITHKHATTTEAIQATSTGLVKQIALRFANLEIYLFNSHRGKTKSARANNKKTFIKFGKQYNQLVAINRMHGMAIDIAVSLTKKRMVTKN